MHCTFNRLQSINIIMWVFSTRFSTMIIDLIYYESVKEKESEPDILATHPSIRHSITIIVHFKTLITLTVMTHSSSHTHTHTNTPRFADESKRTNNSIKIRNLSLTEKKNQKKNTFSNQQYFLSFCSFFFPLLIRNKSKQKTMVKCFLFVAHELNDKKPNTHDLKTTILQKKKKLKVILK